MSTNVLCGLEPQSVFSYFEQLTRIPRGSGNEKAVSDYIIAYAEQHGYRWERDEAYNVKLYAPATSGYENRKSIVLQAHLDMVCAKDPDVAFDFKTQPIDIYVEDGFVKAHGTTLGADDGAGVAMILALLDDRTLPHPPVQAIFTTGEEILFVGAEAMDAHWLDGDYYIGLDYSNNKKILVSAAGVSVLQCTLTLERTPVPVGWTAFDVTISGMQGGHSGNTIHMDRGNAVKVMEEILAGLPAGLASLADISAGTLINIIPAHAEAVVVCPPEHADTVRTALDVRIALLKEVYRHTEPQLTVTVSQRFAGDGMTALTPACAEKLLRFVRLCYVGAWRMADDTYSRAECSANPAILRLEQTEAKFTLSARSNSEYLHDQIIAHQSELAALCGWKAELESRAGAWEYNAASQLLPQVIPIFREVTGREPEIAQIHAGVEGGVFDTKAREIGRRLDMVNLGVMNYDVHTPRERMEIDSVKPLYEMLRQILMTVE